MPQSFRYDANHTTDDLPHMKSKTAPIIPRTDIAKLANDLRDRPYREALPKRLPDHWLRAIARDLRQIERDMAEENSGLDARMEGPLIVAVHIFQGRIRENTGLDGSSFSLSVERVWTFLQIYQFLAERELVARLIGEASVTDEEVLMANVDAQIDDFLSETARTSLTKFDELRE